MNELEAELRRLADRERQVERRAERTGLDSMSREFASSRRAYAHAADLARDHEAKRGGGWMTIASAPRDGEDLILFVFEFGEPVMWVAGWDQVEGAWTDRDRHEIMLDPTHWRPLPEPPVAGVE